MSTLIDHIPYSQAVALLARNQDQRAQVWATLEVARQLERIANRMEGLDGLPIPTHPDV